MKEAKISELKNGLSRYLALVRRGETVRILDRDVPVAHLVPVPTSGRAATSAEALIAMERKGLVRRATAPIAREILDRDPPGRPCGVLDALLDEREAR